MNIYFAGSINGGRERQKDYFELIDYCKTFGNVLTEHVGREDPTKCAVTTYSDRYDENVYLRDTDWINKADILIAEVTIPSLGVGYEIGYAEKLDKPIMCIFDLNGDKKVSAMITGNRNITVKGYSTLDEAKEIIKGFIERICLE
jgi:nucleoside 2-deoxyribosyltransferase